MRETIGGTWITQLVIVFMFVFTAFLALSINYSKAFRVKNEVLTFIEKGEGLTATSIQLIGNYLRNSGYKMTGYCPEGAYGLTIRGVNNTRIEEADSRTKYSLCVTKYKSISPTFPDKAYYEVQLFFKFNLPVIGNITTFDVDGQTKDIAYPQDIDDNITPKSRY